jgi:hypothetical protein
MEKEFVPYELDLRMKALDFDEPCYKVPCLIKDTEQGEYFAVYYVHQNSRPTFSQCFRWFREKYGLFVAPNAISYENGPYLWFFEVNSTILSFGIDLGETDNFENYEEAELACLEKLIEIVEQKEK